MNMSDPTSDFDALEDAIDEAAVPLETLTQAYREFLLRLIDHGRLNSIPPHDLAFIRQCLATPADTDDASISLKKKLWQFADPRRHEHPETYHLARCALMTIAHDADWDAAQDSPISYFLLFLKRVSPAIEAEFIEHFRDTLRLR